MISLCVYDLIYMTASLLMFSLPLLYPNIILSLRFTHSVTFLLPVAQTAMTGQDLRGDQGNKGRTEFEKTPTPMTRFNVNFSEVNTYNHYLSLNKYKDKTFFYKLDFLQSQTT